MPKISKKYEYSQIVDRMLDPRWLSRRGDGERSIEFTSYDRQSKYENGEYVGWDANGDGSGCIERYEDGSILAAEMTGPGYISRIWSASPEAGHIKIYIDGELTFDCPFEDLFNGNLFDFTKLCYVTARGKNCYVPITYSRSCRIILERGWGRFYHIGCTSLGEGAEVEPLGSVLTESQSAALRRLNDHLRHRLGSSPYGVPDGELTRISVGPDATFVTELSGRAAIGGILLRLPEETRSHRLSEQTVELLNDLHIRIFWNGESEAAVDTPISYLFGCSYGIDRIRSLLIGAREDGTLYNYFYMPYTDGARLELSTRGGECELELALTLLPPEDGELLSFHTHFTRGGYVGGESRWPDYGFLSAVGCGRFCGVTLHVYKSSDHRIVHWWGEGDEKFFVDGEKFPSWFGTGTEDFFGYAWCCAEVFSSAYHSLSYVKGKVNDAGNRSLTRILLSDSVPFGESFEGVLEKYYPDEHVHFAFAPYLYLASGGRVENASTPPEGYRDFFELDP